jgi:hypothetical protein
MGLAQPSIPMVKQKHNTVKHPPDREILVSNHQAKERYGLDVVIVPDDEHGQVMSPNPGIRPNIS